MPFVSTNQLYFRQTSSKTSVKELNIVRQGDNDKADILHHQAPRKSFENTVKLNRETERIKTMNL